MQHKNSHCNFVFFFNNFNLACQYHVLVTKEEVMVKIKQLKIRKAHWTDLIPTELSKYAGPEL